MNTRNSILVILRGQLPKSLIPMESLLKMLERVSTQQSKAPDRWSLAIPMTGQLAYNDACLLMQSSW